MLVGMSYGRNHPTKDVVYSPRMAWLWATVLTAVAVAVMSAEKGFAQVSDTAGPGSDQYGSAVSAPEETTCKIYDRDGNLVGTTEGRLPLDSEIPLGGDHDCVAPTEDVVNTAEDSTPAVEESVQNNDTPVGGGGDSATGGDAISNSAQASPAPPESENSEPASSDEAASVAPTDSPTAPEVGNSELASGDEVASVTPTNSPAPPEGEESQSSSDDEVASLDPADSPTPPEGENSRAASDDEVAPTAPTDTNREQELPDEGSKGGPPASAGAEGKSVDTPTGVDGKVRPHGMVAQGGASGNTEGPETSGEEQTPQQDEETGVEGSTAESATEPDADENENPASRLEQEEDGDQRHHSQDDSPGSHTVRTDPQNTANDDDSGHGKENEGNDRASSEATKDGEVNSPHDDTGNNGDNGYGNEPGPDGESSSDETSTGGVIQSLQKAGGIAPFAVGGLVIAGLLVASRIIR